MSNIGQIAIFGWFLAILASPASGPSETALFLFGTNAYPGAILDRPRLEVEADYPELFHPPAVGDALAYRVLRGGDLVREIAGTVVSPNTLECANGPEIHIQDDLRLDLFRALYLTDILHRSPQTIGDGPPLETFPPPSFEILESVPSRP